MSSHNNVRGAGDDTRELATTERSCAEDNNMPAITMFTLENFEWLVQNRDNTEKACQMLLFLLNQLDEHYGQWGECVTAYTPGLHPESLNRHICTRLAGAISTLFSRPGLVISDNGYTRLMNYHRWLALIFAVSSYRHADHIIRNINSAGGGTIDPLTLDANNLRLFCLCYYPDSEIALQPEVLWNFDRQTIVRLFFALLSPRAMPTASAHGKRELLLACLPVLLKDIDDPGDLPVAILHDVVMHCSYADLPEKHAIKRHINRLVRKACEQADFSRLLPFMPPPVREKPVIAVVTEWFSCQHSIWRTHSSTIRALRSQFYVVGLGQAGTSDAITRAIFDTFVEVSPSTAVNDVVNHLSDIQPDIVYYPSVGMFPLTVYLTNLRLAPLQLMALGHPATTHSDCIDGVLVEEDYLGDTDCFSEQVYPLPVDALPYTPPENVRRVVNRKMSFADRQQVTWPLSLPIRVAVCASVMKVNPGFLSTLAEIYHRSRVPVQFCFYMGFAKGLMLDYLRDTIHAILPDAEVNAHMPVQMYQQALNSCEMFVNPFPFGNTNGLVDTVRQGLPGICLSGPEVHSHIDEGLFRRLGLPSMLIAHNREDYIKAALQLLENHEFRESLQKQLQENDVEQVLFRGHPEKFVLVVNDIYQTHTMAGPMLYQKKEV